MARLGGITPPEQDAAVRTSVVDPWDESSVDLELTRARDRGARSRRSSRTRREESQDVPRSSRRKREQERPSRQWEASLEPEPQQESVSAHLGESTVVGVSRRGERHERPSAGRFRLVEDEPSMPRDFWAPLEPEPVAHEDFWDPVETDAPVSEDFWDPVEQEQERAQEEASEASWRQGRNRGKRSSRFSTYEVEAEEARTVRRDWIYTEDERFATRGISGSARRRDAIREGLLAVPRAIGSAFGVAMGHLRGVTVLIVIALIAAMLFAPVRNLYVAYRQLDRLQATYDALLAENEAISHELTVLQSREGIENEARARGFVEAGETKVVVEGLPEEDQLVVDQSDTTAASLTEIDVVEEIPWYTQMLDRLFGYEPET